jgi:heme-degrading monooxygenase HmoA
MSPSTQRQVTTKGEIDMPKFRELDAKVTLAEQMQMSGGPIVLINVFTIDPADEEALIKAWSHDADFMKTQPGYISTQLHKGIGGSTTYLNYAIWESVEAFRNASPTLSFKVGSAIILKVLWHLRICSRN